MGGGGGPKILVCAAEPIPKHTGSVIAVKLSVMEIMHPCATKNRKSVEGGKGEFEAAVRIDRLDPSETVVVEKSGGMEILIQISRQPNR